MEEIREGGKFPTKKDWLNSGKLEQSIANNTIADVGVARSNITEETKKAFKHDPLIIALIQYDCIPIITVLMSDGAMYTFPVVIPRDCRADAHNWASNDADGINLLLIDVETEIVEVIRTVRISFAQKIIEIALKQLELLPDHVDIVVEMSRKNEHKLAKVIDKDVVMP